MFKSDHLPLRFWNKVSVSSDGCWEWTATRQEKGYGQYRHGDGMRLAHRVAYLSLVGPVAEGLELDHLCRKRNCVNPAHLEPVPHAENVRRGEAGRHHSAKTHCPQGHPYSGKNLLSDMGAPLGTPRRRCITCKNEQSRRSKAKKRAAA